MATVINDENLISIILSEAIGKLIADEENKTTLKECSAEDKLKHPLDKDIIALLIKLKPSEPDTNIKYERSEDIREIWDELIKSAIKCLRYFDDREPFQNDPTKIPIAFGADELSKYHKKYGQFESTLYGGSKYYRDHVFHSFRTWLLGLFCILKDWNGGDGLFINNIKIDGEKEESEFNKSTNFFEKISMWTVIALCHDLGYPLEKTKEVFAKTQDMMEEFINEPKVWSNFSFSGIQDDINKYVLKFMCTKMKEKKVTNEEEIKKHKTQDGNIDLEAISNSTDKTITLSWNYQYSATVNRKAFNETEYNCVAKDIKSKYIDKNIQAGIKYHYIILDNRENKLSEISVTTAKKCYNGRIQPKYYLKYAKSLERYKHGIISSIIIYKMLLYFLEADFNLNDDYEFEENDAKQFYIRREILRAIASHTCEDIYNVDLGTFSSLLFICDELQEWGRKSWSEIYNEDNSKNDKLEIENFTAKKIKVEEMINMESDSDEEVIYKIRRIYEKQYEKYKIIFRDGQDSGNRTYGFEKKMIIKLLKNSQGGEERKIVIEYGVGKVTNTKFKIISSCEDMYKKLEEKLVPKLSKSIYGGTILEKVDK